MALPTEQFTCQLKQTVPLFNFMANLILAGAVVQQEQNGVQLTISSTTTVTLPLVTSNNAVNIQGLFAVVTPPQQTFSTVPPTSFLAALPPVPIANANGTATIYVPINTPIPYGSTVVISAGGPGTNNINDSAGLSLSSVAITTCVTVANSAVITSANLTTAHGVYIGQSVTGTGVPAGAYIVAMTSGTSITLNTPATASGTVTLTIGQAINVTSSPAQQVPWGPLNAQVQALFTADPLIALLSSGTFGKVVPLAGSWYRVYAVGNLAPLVEFQATRNGQGVIQQLKSFQMPAGGESRSALAPVNENVNPYPYD